jgi:hypothetical protein
VAGCGTVGLPIHVSPVAPGFWVSNATGCAVSVLVDGTITDSVASGAWFYVLVPVGVHTVNISGCGYSADASVSAAATPLHGVNLLCSGTGFYTVSTY